MEESPTETFAKFVCRTTFEDLPEEVVHQTKRLILDEVACAVGGNITDLGKIAIEFGRELGGVEESTIIGTRYRTSCSVAAFVNGELCNALDLDDVMFMSIHISPFFFPSALAVGEKVKAAGKDLITSVALGYDICGRWAVSLPPAIYVRGTPPKLELITSSTTGYGFCVFGAAAAVGKLLGLDEDKMANAFGIAGYSAPLPLGMKFASTVPTNMIKYGCAGSMAETGVLAALLAYKGFTGDTTVMDGEEGFVKAFGADRCDWNTLVGDLGKRWLIMETSFKPYPCCRCMHPNLDLIMKIVREQKLRPEEIEKIVSRQRPITVDAPLWSVTELRDAMDFQFSNKYTIATAVHRVPIADWQSPLTIRDKRILHFAKNKVEIEHEPKYLEVFYNDTKGEPKVARKHAASVQIFARGTVFEDYTEYAKGDPWTPETRMTDEDLKEKFRAFSSKVLKPSNINKAIDIIYRLDEIDNITELLTSVAV